MDGVETLIKQMKVTYTKIHVCVLVKEITQLL